MLDKGESAIFEGVISLMRGKLDEDHSGCRLYKTDGKSEFMLCEAVLFHAIEKGHADIVKMLIKHGVDVNVKRTKDNSNETPLHLAARSSTLEIVTLLLKNGAEVNAKCNEYLEDEHRDALSYAAERGNKEIVELLLDFGADMNNDDIIGYNKAVYLAARDGYPEIVKLLLDRGATEELDDSMYDAAKFGHLEIVKLFLDRGFSVHTKSFENDPSICAAAEQNHADVVELLLDHGANIDKQIDSNRIALHAALSEGSTETVKLLVNRGANIFITDDNYGMTSLHQAAHNENDDEFLVKFLLDRGVDINQVASDGGTALFYALRQGNLKILDFLLNRGADINIVNKEGRTAVSIAIQTINGKAGLSLAKTFVKHIARMKASNLIVNEKSEDAIKENCTSKGYLLLCEREIARMRAEPFKDSVLTIYDVFQATSDLQFMAFARNETIAEILNSEDFESRFPIYCDSITQRYKKGMLRNQLLGQFMAFFHLISTRRDNALPKLSFSCLHQIFGYLGNDDIMNLLKLM